MKRILLCILVVLSTHGVRATPPETVKAISGYVVVEPEGPTPYFSLSFPVSDTHTEIFQNQPESPDRLGGFFAGGGIDEMTASLGLRPNADGTFKVGLPEGRYRIAVDLVASPYVLRSFTYGTIDLLRNPITVSSGDVADLRLSVAPRAPSSSRKVSGYLRGYDPEAGSGPLTVMLLERSFVSALRSPVERDGSFAFPKVLPGQYTVRAMGSTGPNIATPPIQIQVADSDITDINIAIPVQKKIKGRIILTGKEPLPPLPQLTFKLLSPCTSDCETAVVSSDPAGAFETVLPEGEWTLGEPSGLGGRYRITAMTFGSTDLTTVPFRVEPGAAPPWLIRLTATDVQPFRVSGRVTNLDASMREGGPVTVTLEQRFLRTTPLETVVDEDGLFLFPNVFPGTYVARIRGKSVLGSSESRVTVSNSDVKDLELIPRKPKTISGRIEVEGRSAPPRLALPLRDSSPYADLFDNRPVYRDITVESDGTFQVTLLEGEYRVDSAFRLPEGYMLTAFTYGASDLLRNPLFVSPSGGAELRLLLSYR